jgi:thiamine pyrophosphate-dependent acetolactate synthase large subunit-like protein
VKLAIVGSGLLARSLTASEIIRKSLSQFRPERVLLFPGHDSFNAIVRAQAATLGLAVEEMNPPRPFWVGACPQSVRKRLARGFYARAIAKDADLVLAINAEGRPGASYSQLVEAAKESVVVNLRLDPDRLGQEVVVSGDGNERVESAERRLL